MTNSHALALDTAPEAHSRQIEGWAKSSPAQKLEMVEAMCGDVRTLALAGIRQRYRNATAREQALRLGALTMDPRLMIEAFGWDPDRRGR
jgi:hypothetical protein